MSPKFAVGSLLCTSQPKGDRVEIHMGELLIDRLEVVPTFVHIPFSGLK
jgi:hypothetical protein